MTELEYLETKVQYLEELTVKLSTVALRHQSDRQLSDASELWKSYVQHISLLENRRPCNQNTPT